MRGRQGEENERLGAKQSISVERRVMEATRPDMREEARAGRCREDLAYRLNVAELRLAPLRERREDIAVLFEHFATAAANKLGRNAVPLSGAQLAQLLTHDWPGNVRELANAAERHALGLGSPTLDPVPAGQSLSERMEAYEAQCLRAALRQHGGEIKAVMDDLQLPRRTLNEKMQRHGLLREDFLSSQ